MSKQSTEQAIPPDATEQSEKAQTETQGSYVNPRQAAMEAIATQRRESLAADGVDTGQMGDALTGPVEKADPADPAKGEGEASDEQLATQLALDERPVVAETRVKVKVDGQEIELPLSEVVKSYQKDATASKRLQEATRLLSLAEQKANKVAQSAQPENNSLQPADDDARKARRSQLKGAFSKLYEGDEDGAAEAMDRLFEQGATATQQVIDPEQITARVIEQLAVKSAYQEVQSDYPELFLDTERGVVLGKETHSRMVAKVALGLASDQALQESAEEVAKLFGIEKKGRQQTEPQRTARDTKLERKAALDHPESANVAAGNTLAPAEAPNVSAVIAEMARGRLGQSLGTR